MNCAPTPTVATATMAAAPAPTAGCTRRRLRVERPALTVVIVFLQMLFWPGYVSQDCSAYVSQDCSARASLSSALATKLLEENQNFRMAASWNAGLPPRKIALVTGGKPAVFGNGAGANRSAMKK